ncbi:MAG: RNA-splicing ligase RtcB [Spirochaetes bacterium]|nr:MAG: RNA-splicing ligase RtcB [Spirochaetota bacterium]
MHDIELEQLDKYRFKIPKSYRKGMRVDGIIYADNKFIGDIKKDNAFQQVANVAFLPGIVRNSLAMPDIHWGYGFCIGGVAATDPENDGVISPGGVGFDINCGVRLLRTNLYHNDIKNKIADIANSLYQNVPSGLGSKGKIKLTFSDEKKLVREGAKWAVKRGLGENNDLECCEENGAIPGADPEAVSKRAYERGKQQVGTLGSGNHFLEVQVVDKIFDIDKAKILGLEKGQITVMIHSGSRGFGYQVCDDYIKVMLGCLSKYNISIPDRQLACAPLNSKEARQYLGAMNAAANYAWCNRQVLMHLVRESFEKVLSSSWQSLGMNLIYDVTHNIAKIEEHTIDGKRKTLCVHRKGATRAFGPGSTTIPVKYRELGQPVIIPGDMGRASYLLVGTKKAEIETFASTCHGAGRIKSRHQALKTVDLNNLIESLKSKGIEVRATGKKTIIEEAPEAYKDIDDVVNIVHNCGISLRICRMKPLCVVKG